MKRLLLLPVMIGLAVSAPALSASPEGAGAEQIAANAKAKRLGEQIFRHDQAAWKASDELNAQLRAENRPEFLTYMTEELDNGNVRVVFYTKIDEKLFEFVVFEIDGGNVVYAKMHDDPKQHPLSDFLLGQVAARDAAMQEGARQQLPLCRSGSANFVTLPPDEDGMVSVYILSPPVTPGRFPIGGHYLFRVNAEGKPVSGRAFENSCLDGPRLERYVPNGPTSFPFVHQLDNHPTEIHHFAARHMNVPLSITAAELTWEIDYTSWTAEEIAAGESLMIGAAPTQP
ncbi:hypothetical protein [Pontixanthobacter aquaemixtae]|uniref:Uncharacterized protein n=1 Tax=Pontixanthobacter aquaemixtae TaxID=1958940 RepID=A0A844ZSV1_9SPHN|nr:hypothetical protein [Pontixanthobacter aquaemixtae]MXO90935.1 hypothetical protein [Pontixanthobacter aquaemixtae]